jgi:penicillin-insensitive murein endopeptidase
MSDTEGNPAYPERFERFGGDGRSRDVEGLVFDDTRNWELMASLLQNEAAPVQYVFVSDRLKERLLAEGRRRGASRELLTRAYVVLSQPRRGGVHDDHFHIRIFCAPDDRPRCADRPPFYPWAPGGQTLEDQHPALAMLD